VPDQDAHVPGDLDRSLESGFDGIDVSRGLPPRRWPRPGRTWRGRCRGPGRCGRLR
jgi:hypothetical protein